MRPYIPRGAITLDTNFRHVVSYSGSKVRRHRTRFIGALSKKARAEEIKRKHPKRWRFNEKIMSMIKELHGRSRLWIGARSSRRRSF